MSATNNRRIPALKDLEAVYFYSEFGWNSVYLRPMRDNSHGAFLFWGDFCLKVRKFLMVVCYMLALAAYSVCGYITYLSWNLRIIYKFGFLLFLPIWIVGFWFSTFFSQLSLVGKKSLCGKHFRHFLDWLTSFLSFILLLAWGYLMYKQYRLTGTLI